MQFSLLHSSGRSVSALPPSYSSLLSSVSAGVDCGDSSSNYPSSSMLSSSFESPSLMTSRTSLDESIIPSSSSSFAVEVSISVSLEEVGEVVDSVPGKVCAMIGRTPSLSV